MNRFAFVLFVASLFSTYLAALAALILALIGGGWWDDYGRSFVLICGGCVAVNELIYHLTRNE